MIKISKYLYHFREPVMMGIRYGMILKQALEHQTEKRAENNIWL